MKNYFFLPLIIPALLTTACAKDAPADEPATVVAAGAYTGTLSVDQNDGTFYAQENVHVVFTPKTEGEAEIKMFQASFSPKMPLKLDMTVPGVVAVETPEGLSLSGDNIVPLAMGGEFPQYTITGITGKATPGTLSFEMKCGAYPLAFSGVKDE
jgi:hypothetical protein